VNLGEIWWADLPDPSGSGPGYRRPVVVVQADEFNRSRIQTVVVAAVTSNMRLAAAPGNVALVRPGTGLSREPVVNVSQVLTLDKRALTERAGKITGAKLREVQDGLRLVLAL
jgi:mRNA interferase MazF